jgi:hypothetical protein
MCSKYFSSFIHLSYMCDYDVTCITLHADCTNTASFSHFLQIMPALRQIKSFHTLNAYLVPPETVVSSMLSLPHVSELHGGRFPHTYSRHHPYPLHIPSPVKTQHHANMNLKPVLPPTLLDTIKLTQDAAVNRGTRLKDASRLREFLEFCEGLGIKHSAALPAREDVLMAWASSYAGRLAGKTVSA